MAQVSPQHCTDLQVKHNLPYWRIMDKSKKLVIDRNQSNVLDESIEELKNTLAACMGDSVYVTLYEFKPEKMGEAGSKGKSFDCIVKLNDPYLNTSSRQNIAGAPTFNDLLALHSKIQLLEIEKIKSQYEEINGSKQSSVDKLINKLLETDIITLLLSSNMKPANNTGAINAPANNDLEKALVKLEIIDPNYKNTLIKMAEYLHNNPGVLPQIKAIIGA
jgi:hypothetical protein